MRYYSCDSHLVEAREIFEGLESRFGDRARLYTPTTAPRSHSFNSIRGGKPLLEPPPTSQ